MSVIDNYYDDGPVCGHRDCETGVACRSTVYRSIYPPADAGCDVDHYYKCHGCGAIFEDEDMQRKNDERDVADEYEGSARQRLRSAGMDPRLADGTLEQRLQASVELVRRERES